MSWTNLPTDAQADSNWDNYMEVLSEPIIEPKKPDTTTVLVDYATEVEKARETSGEPEKKVFEKRKEEGFSMAPPVDIYEPGFRGELYDAIVNYWKQKHAERNKLNDLRKKLGIRS